MVIWSEVSILLVSTEVYKNSVHGPPVLVGQLFVTKFLSLLSGETVLFDVLCETTHTRVYTTSNSF